MLTQFVGTAVMALALVLQAAADDQVERAKLMGSWKLLGRADSGPATQWTFSAMGAELQVTQIEGDKVVARFKCATKGMPCEIKSDGRKATMSMWYNGAKLVQMETSGSDVVKRRFGVLPQGDVMELEIVPVVPSGKTETYRFQRSPISSSVK